MDTTLIAAIIGIVALLIGIFAGKMLFAKNTQKTVEDAEAIAKKLVDDAKKMTEDEMPIIAQRINWPRVHPPSFASTLSQRVWARSRSLRGTRLSTSLLMMIFSVIQ